jgi:Protein of unknown function (DUF1559)
MIEFNCSCGTPLQAEEQHVGRLTRCPQCGREQPIPAGDGSIRSDVRAEHVRGRSTNVQEEPDGRFGVPLPTVGQAATPPKSKTWLFVPVGIAIPVLLIGIPVLLSCCVLSLIGLLIPAVQKVRESASRTQSSNNLKQIGLAMHSYNDANGFLPPAQSTAPLGIGPNPGGMHKISWRVRILPYIEQQALYMQYREDEPWDGPNNSRLLQSMPKVYQLPGDETAPPGYTYYQVFVSAPLAFPRAIFSTDPNDHVSLQTITDGTANTIMVVEGATPVPWTKPDDIPFDNNGPAPALGTHFNRYHILFADGSVQFLPDTLPATTLKAYITRDGGELVALPR